MVQSLSEGGQRQRCEGGDRQFDRQGQAIEALTDLSDKQDLLGSDLEGRVYLACPFKEEGDCSIAHHGLEVRQGSRIRHSQGFHMKKMFAPHVKGLAACNDLGWARS